MNRLIALLWGHMSSYYKSYDVEDIYILALDLKRRSFTCNITKKLSLSQIEKLIYIQFAIYLDRYYSILSVFP